MMNLLSLRTKSNKDFNGGHKGMEQREMNSRDSLIKGFFFLQKQASWKRARLSFEYMYTHDILTTTSIDTVNKHIILESFVMNSKTQPRCFSCLRTVNLFS